MPFFCTDLGALIGKGGFYGNVFRITPPLCFTREDAGNGHPQSSVPWILGFSSLVQLYFLIDCHSQISLSMPWITQFRRCEAHPAHIFITYASAMMCSLNSLDVLREMRHHLDVSPTLCLKTSGWVHYFVLSSLLMWRVTALMSQSITSYMHIIIVVDNMCNSYTYILAQKF